ncbi:hypothetical protein [Vacuolonema iberomarrocanum]|uniref:hypothetical protein n=1 Tax=Vacuolonema iberomarrocanum TaxID=3454632 RepID=UPI0019E9E715|nr:hypothetical protein [filamentous cyanobacterium LEGE 07170]
MPTYEDVLNLAQMLDSKDQNRLLMDLAALVYDFAEVIDSDEVIPAETIAESELALQAYQSGKDPGLSADDLKHLLFGDGVE